MSKAMNLRLATARKSIHEAAQKRRENRHMSPVWRDMVTERLLYADGTPIPPDDPRYRFQRDWGWRDEEARRYNRNKSWTG